MPRALIFLDFDGVLNRGAGLPVASALERRQVQLLNELVRLSGASIVLSTAWRIGRSVAELRDILTESGFRYGNRVIGMTPYYSNLIRGEEIAAWRKSAGMCRVPFVILDDLEQMGELEPYLVRTDPDRGLERADVILALSILRAQMQRRA